MKKETIFIYGKHALVEALKNSPSSIEKIFLAPNNSDIFELAKKAGISVGEMDPEMEKDASHQGVIGRVGLEKLLLPFSEFKKDIEVKPNTSLVLLGGLQDPQNVGGIIRSAAAFGISGVIIPEHNQAGVTGAVVKVSAGMVFRIPLIKIGNIDEAIRALKEKGFKIYGLAGEGSHSIADEKFEAPSVFIFGNESKGLDPMTREACDSLLSIPMDPRCESLNVSASAAIALYSWSLCHDEVLK